MSYMTISSHEKHNFSLCSCFHAHPTTLLLKILGGQCMGGPPHLKFWGDRPPSPPRSPPLALAHGDHVCLKPSLLITGTSIDPIDRGPRVLFHGISVT